MRALVGVFLVLTVVPSPAAVRLPDPASVVAPGAKEAPASDPATYPDEAGFRQRGKQIVAALAKEDLSRYRKGFFLRGDPGKYVPGPAMARLLLDPTDAEALRYMNDERSPRETYHFAIVNWARFLPQFGEFLTADTRAALGASVGRAGMLTGDYGLGTENHVVMQVASGVVLPDYVEGGRVANLPAEDARQKAKEWLRDYVRKLYHFGQGEWDSSSYLPYYINALLNVYDFSKDEECRRIARAGLDWFAATYALKYVNGMHTGPKERGWTSGIGSGVDSIGLLWWGTTRTLTAEHPWGRTVMHAYLSGYRPNAAICHIAARRLPALPAEFRNSKPNYWTGLDTPAIEPVANVSRESLYITAHYTLGSLWHGENVCIDLTRMQLGARTPEGAVSFTGSAPGRFNDQPRYFACQGTHVTRPPGNYATEIVPNPVPPKTVGMYVQYAQAGPTLICMAALPADEKDPFTYFTAPVAVEKAGDWHLMQAGETYVAVRPLNGAAEECVLDKTPALKFPGRQSGFILRTGDTTAYASRGDFAKALAAQPPDLSAWAKDMRVTCGTLDGRKMSMQYAAGKGQAAVAVDGAPASYDGWPVYNGPYIAQKDGVLSVNDGQDGFVVDFGGRLPIYRPWKP